MIAVHAPHVPHPLSEELVELMSDRLLLVGHPTRIRILDTLRAGEQNVQSVADGLRTTQQNVSGHLRLLRAAGVVSRRVSGREAYYAVRDASVFELWKWSLGALWRQQPSRDRRDRNDLAKPSGERR